MPHIKEIKESTVKRALRLHQQWLDSNYRKGRQLIVTDEIVNKLNFEKIKDFSGANFSQANFFENESKQLELFRCRFL